MPSIFIKIIEYLQNYNHLW